MMGSAKPPDFSHAQASVEGDQEEERGVEVQKGDLGKESEIQSRSLGSKGALWVTVAQEKKVLRKYELQITESEGQKSVEIPDDVINNANLLWEDYLIGKFLDTAPHIEPYPRGGE